MVRGRSQVRISFKSGTLKVSELGAVGASLDKRSSVVQCYDDNLPVIMAYVVAAV